MTFGKYKSRHVSQVPSDYLAWCLREAHYLKPWLRFAIDQELRRRVEVDHEPEEDSNLPAKLTQVIDRWYRDLCLRWHPDRGGSDQAMQAVNDAHDRLRKLVEVA
jgi:hypothetical protein